MNPITKEETKAITDYKKVPVLVADGIIVRTYLFSDHIILINLFWGHVSPVKVMIIGRALSEHL